MLSILIYVVMKLPESLLKSKLPKKKKIRRKGYVCPADIFVCRYLIATVVFSTNKQSLLNLLETLNTDRSPRELLFKCI